MADPKSLIIKLAHIYYHTGSWDKALVEYDKILALDPNDWNVHTTVGEIYVKKGELEKAFREFEKAADGFLASGNTKKAAAPLRELASLIQKTVEPQDLDRAIQLYEANLRKMPDSVENLVNLRDLYQRHNHTEEAYAFTLRLADLYNRLDYVEKAEAEYRKALELKPGDAVAKAKLEALRREPAEGPPPGAP